MIKKLIKWLHRGDTQSDLYRQGHDYMDNLLNTLNERAAANVAWQKERDYSNPFDAGVIDCWNQRVNQGKVIPLQKEIHK